MSKRELAAQLASVLEAETEALIELERAMRERRTAYVALRPSEVEAGVAALEQHADECRELAAKREQLQAQLGTRLADIVAALPPSLARRVENAAANLRDAAGRLRVENGVGARLLEFSRRAQESMLLSLYADSTTSGYDRHAQAVRHGAPRGTFVTGTL